MTEKMNALRNKKGFTLIEMLVVIAIIAVLVAIVIPVVGNSTNKAACAANAANLRAIKAEVTTAYLTKDTSKYTFTETVTDGKVTAIEVAFTDTTNGEYPTAKKTTSPVCAEGAEMDVTYNAAKGEFVVTYGEGLDIDAFSKGAEGTDTDE